VPPVAAQPELRALLRQKQHDLANDGEGVVMVGRDIGSVVLPDAELKVFLTASLEERARRRYVELCESRKNGVPVPDLATVVEDIRRRDTIDHDHSLPAPDAIIIMTDHLGVLEVLDVILSYLKETV
jgi:cytidylate kinase